MRSPASEWSAARAERKRGIVFAVAIYTLGAALFVGAIHDLIVRWF